MAKREQRNRRAEGSTPTIKVFIPYLILGAVLLLAFIWIYVIGPSGDSEDRGQLLHLQDQQTIETEEEDDTLVEEDPMQGVPGTGAANDTEQETSPDPAVGAGASSN